MLLSLVLAAAPAVQAGVLSDRLLRGESVPAPVIGEETQDPFDFDPGQPVVSRGFGLDGGAAWQRDYNAGLSAIFDKDYAKAVELWTPLAAAGYTEAQVSLAWLYQTGAGLPQDYARAHALYAQAAAQGHAIARNNLGVLYEKGWGIARDLVIAAGWYRRSAESGYKFAQYNLGALCSDNPIDSCDGAEWLRLAAEQGVEAAKEKLEALRQRESAP
jgi:TPR repeat protein